MRFVTLEEFRLAADILGRYSDLFEEFEEDSQEHYYDNFLRTNAKFVVALYFEQIRLLHLFTPEQLRTMR